MPSSQDPKGAASPSPPGMAAARAQQIAQELKRLGACAEVQEWLHSIPTRPQATTQTTMQTTAQAAQVQDAAGVWRTVTAPPWLCWISVRLLGMQGLRAPLAVVRHTASLAVHPTADALLQLCEDHISEKRVSENHTPKRAEDSQALFQGAYDASQAALTGAAKNPQALLAIAYLAHAIAQVKDAQEEKDPERKRKKEIRAASQAADAAAFAWDAAGQNATQDLARMTLAIRTAIPEAQILKAWDLAMRENPHE